jgi:hypothetical protein
MSARVADRVKRSIHIEHSNSLAPGFDGNSFSRGYPSLKRLLSVLSRYLLSTFRKRFQIDWRSLLFQSRHTPTFFGGRIRKMH